MLQLACWFWTITFPIFGGSHHLLSKLSLFLNMFQSQLKHHQGDYLLTYNMKRSPFWETNRFSASQEIPRILWNPKVHYHLHKCPPPVPILIQINPVHTTTTHFLNIPSMPGSHKWSLSLRFLHQNPVYASPQFALHAPPISFFSILSP